MEIQVTLKRALIGAGVLLALILGLALYFTQVRNSYHSQIVDLQNQNASLSKTIEVDKGVFEKKDLQVKNLEDLLNSQDDDVKALREQLEHTNARLLTANTIVVELRKELEAKGTATTEPKDPDNPGVVKVRFDTKDQFDPFEVLGETVADCSLTAPSSYTATMRQTRPFKLSVVVSQDKDGTWKTTTSSSEKNFQVDIQLAAVNPYMLAPKWYEKVGFDLELGVSTSPGLLGGVGIIYEIGKFEVGPKVFVTLDRSGVSPYFGAVLGWHPFKRD